MSESEAGSAEPKAAEPADEADAPKPKVDPEREIDPEPKAESQARPAPTPISAGANRAGRSELGDNTDLPDDRSTRKLAEVNNYFTGTVMAQTIGVGGGPGERPASPNVLTGRLEDAEIRAETAFYFRPDHFDDAVERLQVDRVVVVSGPAGAGKRTGGINLLREVTTERLVVISAVSELKELSRAEYAAGQGYLIVNRVDDSRVDDVDFAWRRVRDRVRKCGAYLVITTAAAVDPHVKVVGQFSWERPDLTALTRSYLVGEDIAEEMVELIGEQLPPECAMADVTGVLRSIRDGEEPATALDKLTERSAERVREWFDRHENNAQAIVDVATLAFLGEVIYREFESLRQGLEESLRRHGAIKPPRTGGNRPKKTDPEQHVLSSRIALVCDDGLITERRVAGPISTRRMLGFRSADYRRHVLGELCRRCPTPFWNAVAAWLAGLVADEADVEVAFGLADLGACDFDEVQLTYLTPWSRGEIGPTGQITAVFVLWAMCFRDDTQPAALKVAKQWANHGDPEQRWSAAMAYSGVLGGCDSEQAIRQLWHLLLSAGTGFDYACRAMAVLFATLLETGNSGKVLSTLDQQLRRAPTRPADRNAVLRARQVLTEVLTMRENRPKVPATFLYLKRYPHRLELVASLWAAGIRYQPFRRIVLEALWHGLNRLSHITDDAGAFASSLGEALVNALPSDEVEPFYENLRTVDAASRSRAKGQPSPALVLLDVIEKHYRRKAS